MSHKKEYSKAWFKRRALAKRAEIFVSGIDRFQQCNTLDRYDLLLADTIISDNRWMIDRMWNNGS